MPSIGTLTATKTAPKPKAHPNAPLMEMVHDAYADHQRWLTRLDQADTARQKLRERIRNGEAWLRRHDSHHPRYERNRAILDALRHDLKQNRWLIRDLNVARIGAALEMWGAFDALTEIEQAAVKAQQCVDAVFRPSAEKYYAAIQNWGNMSDFIEIPFK